jgi:hypothetical protein
MYEFLRILPMSIADWLNEWFETEILKASLAAAGILGSFVGPRAQGTSLISYHQPKNRTARSEPRTRPRRYRYLPQAIARCAEHPARKSRQARR